jgi:hypothetical protein
MHRNSVASRVTEKVASGTNCFHNFNIIVNLPKTYRHLRLFLIGMVNCGTLSRINHRVRFLSILPVATWGGDQPGNGSGENKPRQGGWLRVALAKLLVRLAFLKSHLYKPGITHADVWL